MVLLVMCVSFAQLFSIGGRKENIRIAVEGRSLPTIASLVLHVTKIKVSALRVTHRRGYLQNCRIEKAATARCMGHEVSV